MTMSLISISLFKVPSKRGYWIIIVEILPNTLKIANLSLVRFSISPQLLAVVRQRLTYITAFNPLHSRISLRFDKPQQQTRSHLCTQGR